VDYQHHDGRIQEVPGNIVDNSALIFAPVTTETYGGVISGSGTVQLYAAWGTGAHTLDLTGANSYTGGTTVCYGMLEIGHNMTLGTVTVASGATFQINSGYTLTHTGALSDSGTIANNGTLVDNATIDVASGGTLTNGSGSVENLNYAMTIEGRLTNGGSLDVDAAFTDNGTVTNAASVTISSYYCIGIGSTTTATLTNSGTIYTAGGLHVYSHGTLTNNSGATVAITYGASQIDSGGTISNSGTFNINATSLTFYDYGTFTGNVVVASGNTFEFCQSANVTYAGVISGAGNVVIACASYTVIFTNANTLTGTVTVSSGTLQLGNGTTNGSIQNAAALVDNAIVKYMETGGFTPGQQLSGNGSLVDDDVAGALAYANLHNNFTGTHSNIGGGTLTW